MSTPIYEGLPYCPKTCDTITNACKVSGREIVQPNRHVRGGSYSNRHPERFFFGTDNVASQTQEKEPELCWVYRTLLALLEPEAKHLLLKGNYERILDEARRRDRAWEKAKIGHP